MQKGKRPSRTRGRDSSSDRQSKNPSQDKSGSKAVRGKKNSDRRSDRNEERPRPETRSTRSSKRSPSNRHGESPRPESRSSKRAPSNRHGESPLPESRSSKRAPSDRHGESPRPESRSTRSSKPTPADRHGRRDNTANPKRNQSISRRSSEEKFPARKEERKDDRGRKYPANPRKNTRRKVSDAVKQQGNEPALSGKIRLNKYIANSGVCSRREADELIQMGLVTVNGKTVTELGYKVDPTDQVRHEGKLLRAEKPVYILMNKPKGYLTTTKDPQERNTVMSLLGNSVRERIYPVGRLDRNTTGLLLLTNDGDLAVKLSHPSYEVKKIYKVELDRGLAKGDAEKIMQGVTLEEGRAIPDDFAIISDDRKTVGLELHIGWNRVVRRIFEALDYQVVRLDRTVYAGLDKKELPRGKWRFLRPDEVVRLKHFR